MGSFSMGDNHEPSFVCLPSASASLSLRLGAAVMGCHLGSAASRPRDALRREFARVAWHRAARQRGEYDADGCARRVGPTERARGTGMAEGSLRTSGTAGFLAD